LYPESCNALIDINYTNYLNSLHEDVLVKSISISPAEKPQENIPRQRVQHIDASNMFVVMPFSDSAKWENITKNLQLLEIKLFKANFKSYMIQDTIMSYNTQQKNFWNFDNLHALLSQLDFKQENMRNLIRKIVQLVIELPSLLPHQIV